MLKLCVPYCLSPLTNIINFSLETGEVPSIWKESLITPIPKIEDPTLNDLRPISILPTPSKILEKVVKKQLYSFVNNNKILPKYQSGFRPYHSCATALLKITSDIVQSLDRGHCCPLVLIDMTKAFDSLNIDLLLAKLKSLNIATNNWFKSYLLDRRQAISLQCDGGMITSNWTSVQSGVPQGSILGPLLFTIFTSDFDNILQQCSYHMYADDLQIYLDIPLKDTKMGISALSEDLNRISNWATKNSLMINPKKNQAIMFSRTDLNTDNLDIRINGTTIEWKDEVKNLGLFMDKKLTFNKHVNSILQRSYLRLKSLFEFKNILPKPSKRVLTESCVLSIPGYLDLVYGPFLTNFNKYRIQKIQNTCVRYIHGLARRDHVSWYVTETFGCGMSQRRFVHLSCLIYKIVHIKEPYYLHNVIVLREDIHQVNTRHRHLIEIPRHHKEFFKSCFYYVLAYLYNLFPDFFHCNFSTFKRNVLEYIVHTPSIF